jgi:hypothetical protein
MMSNHMLERHEIQDPATRLVAERIDNMVLKIKLFEGAVADNPVSDLKELAKLVEELDSFKMNCTRFVYLPDFSIFTPLTDADYGLNHLLANTEEFTALFQRVESMLARLGEQRRLRGLEPAPTENLAPLRADYNSVLKLAESITVSHIKLQLHCQSFITAERERGDGLEQQRIMLYRPLLVLRDEYFVAPRAGLLTEYLRCAESISSNPFYTSGLKVDNLALWRHYQEVMERYTLELEVLSMLESGQGSR